MEGHPSIPMPEDASEKPQELATEPPSDNTSAIALAEKTATNDLNIEAVAGPAKPVHPLQPPGAMPNAIGATVNSLATPLPPSDRHRPRRLEVDGFPDQPEPGSKRVPTTIDNVAHLLAQHGITPRYNVIKKKLMVMIPGHKGTSDNLDNSVMTNILSIAALNGMNVSQIPAIVAYLGDRHSFNPAADWINSRPWDGINRLQDFYNTVETVRDYPPYLKDTLIGKWLLSLVAAALAPTGFKCRGVLTLQGPQNIGKTSWGMSLINEPMLREQLIKVDHHMDGSNKDSILGAVSHWITEIGELDSSFRKDIARLKGFLTSDYDKIRRPYARAESEYQRRTVFFATVNDQNFLVDQTGNSRWWTIAVKSLNFKHGIDMQQVFAQLAVDFHQGAQWWLDQEEEETLELYNRQHRTVSVIRGLLEERLDLSRKNEPDLKPMTPIKVLKMVGIDRPTNAQCKECAAILQEWLGQPKRIRGEWVYRIPLREGSSGSSPMDSIGDFDGY